MVVLGRITVPYGIKGWVKVHPFGDDPLAWQQMPVWWLADEPDGPEGTWREMHLAEFRPHGKAWIAKFLGIDDRAAAEALSGRYVACPRESLPETALGEFYWADLIGLRVLTLSGISLGSVDQLMETGANSVLVIRDADKERLLPFVEHCVHSVDLAGGRILVDWSPEW